MQKARSAFYVGAGDAKPMKTVEAWQAFSQFSPQASMIWLDRLKSIDEEDVRRLLDLVPKYRLSQVGRAFTLEFLMANRRRLLTGDNP